MIPFFPSDNTLCCAPLDLFPWHGNKRRRKLRLVTKSWRIQFLRFQGKITGDKVTNKSYLSLFIRHSQRWILALLLSDRTWLMSCIWKKKDSPEQSFLYLCVRTGNPLQTSLPKPVVMNSPCNMLQEELLLERMVKPGHFFLKGEKMHKTLREGPVMWNINLLWDYAVPFLFFLAVVIALRSKFTRLINLIKQVSQFVYFEGYFPLQKGTDSEQVTHFFMKVTSE